jgi:hypothetical protein
VCGDASQAVSTGRLDRAVPAHALADYRISWHGRRYRVLPDRGVSSYEALFRFYNGELLIYVVINMERVNELLVSYGCPTAIISLGRLFPQQMKKGAGILARIW